MDNKKLQFVFFGTSDVSKETLDILKDNGYMPSFIVTSPDKPVGRKMLVTPPLVKIWAEENNIPYIQPEKLNEEVLERLKSLNSDLFIVVAYGKIMPQELIQIPKLGSINIHYSILPRWRGASPVESAILAGDDITGITIQQMEYKMDAGPIIALKEVEIDKNETAPELRTRLIKIGGDLLVNILPDFIENKIKTTPQDESKATYCKKIKKDDGLIVLETESPSNLFNKFRAYANWPRIFYFKDNKRVIITDAVLENNTFIIKRVIPEGKKEVTWEEFNSK
ncbi:MAG: methionyl-tRNA formyltransferase [Patescibacteria group bacterium]